MAESDLEERLRRPQLRVDLHTPVVVALRDEPVRVLLHVRNTGSVIETIDVRLVGLLAESVERTPAEITLFPEEEVEVTLDLVFHRALPAGPHEGILVVSGRSDTVEAAELLLKVEVPARPATTLAVEPPLKTARRKATFEVLVENDGNTTLDLLLQASDADKLLDLTLTQRKLVLRADQGGYAILGVRAPRKWTGPPFEHVVTLTAEGDGVTQTAEARLRQLALLTPGVVTILTLLLIVVLWTLAMLFGVQAALSSPLPTKTMPASFTEGLGADDLDPTLVGGAIGGTVLAASTDQPVPRATIEVFDARGELVTATATGDDGAFEVAGLLPSRYRLRLSAPGFADRWWPDAPDASTATDLLVATDTVAAAGVTRLGGLSGALGGEVIAGDGGPVPTTVELVAIDLVDEPAPLPPITTDPDGFWSATGLTAPATYLITYRAPGYAPVELVQELGAGEQVTVNATRLPAAPGAISGIVQNRAGTPLGGVEVIAQRGDTTVTTTTPTSGAIGTFAFEDLETPGNYLLTFTADGYASETQGVRLAPGQSVADVMVVLSDAAGTIRGQVTAATGESLGGVTVTVTGGETSASTDTLTSGAVGSYRVGGLPLPGTYTVTFDVEGYARQSVQVFIGSDEPEAVASVVLTRSVGRLTGRVVDASSGTALPGATVEVSDGANVRRTTTASAPADQVGRFNAGELAPGTYTITVTVPGGGTTTVLQTVTAAAVSEVTIQVAGP